jgi:hypothetical protein
LGAEAAVVDTVTYRSAGSVNAKPVAHTYSMGTIVLSEHHATVARGDILPHTVVKTGTYGLDYVFTKANLAASGLPLTGNA